MKSSSDAQLSCLEELLNDDSDTLIKTQIQSAATMLGGRIARPITYAAEHLHSMADGELNREIDARYLRGKDEAGVLMVSLRTPWSACRPPSAK